MVANISLESSALMAVAMIDAQCHTEGRLSLSQNTTKGKTLGDTDAVISFLMGILLCETKAQHCQRALA